MERGRRLPKHIAKCRFMAIDSGIQLGKIHPRDDVDLDGGALCSKLQKLRIQGGSIVRSALFGKPKRFVELPIRMLSIQPIAIFGKKTRIPDVESRRELHVVSYRTS